MMACDTCGKTGVQLTQLRDIYKTEHICDICPECEKTINRHLSDLQSVTAKLQIGWMKRFLENMKKGFLA